MPSYAQKIEVLKNVLRDKMCGGKEETFQSADEDGVMKDRDDYNTDQGLAYALRDFLGDKDKIVADDEPFSATVGDQLPYIDEPASEEGSHSDEEQPMRRDTEDVLSNAACRLRRWRAASWKLRRPRNKSGDGGEKSSTQHNSVDLLDRPRGSMVGTSAGLLTLAPPPPAATAPPSPGCLLTPTLADQSTAEYFGSSPECCTDSMGLDDTNTAPGPPPGPRYKLATEGSLRICGFQHTRTVVDKILTTKFLRRWETHTLCLLASHVISKTPSGFLERPLPYSKMQEVYRILRWDPARKYCLRIVMPQGSLLLQANDAYTRDQWYHSILWKRNLLKYSETITKSEKKEVVMKELKNMVDFAMTTPLQDEAVTRAPIQILTSLLSENIDDPDWETWADDASSVAAPLLAERCAGGELCGLLARLCRRIPRSAPLPALAPPVRRVLTRNVDFGKAPEARSFVKDYISALSAQNSGRTLVRRFVEITHGSCASCPHPRAAPNLVAVALAALDDHHRDMPEDHTCTDFDGDVLCFADILEQMCEYEEWLVIVSGVLQPVPLCAGSLRCPLISMRLANVMRAMARDPRCCVHSCLAPSRTARHHPPSWLKAAAPSDPILTLPKQELCQLWGDMLGCLLKCCFKRKSFLQSMSKHLADFVLVALTQHPAALQALSLMLEWDVAGDEQMQLEIIAALQATELGQKYYNDLCERQKNLLKLQSEGGPRRLALPVKATDKDVATILEAGCYGNLECLSLAFTSVTSECAHHLIKLPSLRYLNLWATQFGDSGVQLIAEHLPRLQVLNLCETPVSDKGVEALSTLSSLRRLNLNSTNLSAETFESLRQRLPQLQQYDIRYTEAW